MNTEDLRQKYPELFYQEEEPQTPINLFGVETNPGWDSIIEAMCYLIYRRYKSAKCSYDYYKAKTEPTEDEIKLLQQSEFFLKAKKEELPKICQIKEKFGGLRVYADNLTPYVDGIIDMAEVLADVTCEKCGHPGKTYTIGWHKTLCLEHARERYGKVVDIPEREETIE